MINSMSIHVKGHHIKIAGMHIVKLSTIVDFLVYHVAKQKHFLEKGKNNCLKHHNFSLSRNIHVLGRDFLVASTTVTVTEVSHL